VSDERRHVEDLADFVKRMRHEKDLSQRDVELKSGGEISKGYIGQIENRDVLGDSVTPQKLKALAAGLSVSEDEIFAVARGMNRVGELSLDEARVLEFYRALPSDRREDALAHLELQYKRHGQARPQEMELLPLDDFGADREALAKGRKDKPDGKPGRNSGTKR
jgi:transcriptional regulator with XRE-family HTH domain